MAATHIMLICATGLSSKMLSSKMRKAADAKGIDAVITAVSASDAQAQLVTREIDVLLLGPQVRYMRSKYTKTLKERNIAVDVIEIKVYGMLNGEKILEKAMQVSKTGELSQ